MEKLLKAVEKNEKLILDTQKYVWENPETGYKEFKTSAYLEKVFKSMGYEITKAKDIPGFYAVLDTGKEGPEVLILGELDSVICPEHPEADKETGAVHACGHNAQCGTLVGIAAALKEEGALDGLCGKIKLCAVPAEELLEIEFRTGLIKEGKIKYYGGKTEFMHRGFFDTTDIAFMFHTDNRLSVDKGSVGIIAKQLTYEGVAAHAGAAPWDGRNALYAATCGLNAANALRETFKEEDIIRFHPIMTSGGDMVNSIPSSARIESYVRGRTYGAMQDASRRINQALCGAALSLGTNVDITDSPGYAPLENSSEMIDLLKEAVSWAVPDEKVFETGVVLSGSTDMGDLSQVMPVVHPYTKGSNGKLHKKDFCIDDPAKASIEPAKIGLAMIYLLLWDNAKRANEIKKGFKPNFGSIKEYLAYIDSLNVSGKRIEYKDGEAVIKLG
ncbi:MAG: amidohydrolase [Clostridia bacterium]|nr:amidohydrolase [Clostridia bacterium]